jgi:hypothetical protein
MPRPGHYRCTTTYLKYALSPIPDRKPGGYGHAEWLARS